MTEVKCGMKDNRKADIRRPMYDADLLSGMKRTSFTGHLVCPAEEVLYLEIFFCLIRKRL